MTNWPLLHAASYGFSSVATADAAALNAVKTLTMNETPLHERAEQHAAEAERLLAGRMGFVNNIIKANAHATLAVYYADAEQRATEPQPSR